MKVVKEGYHRLFEGDQDTTRIVSGMLIDLEKNGMVNYFIKLIKNRTRSVDVYGWFDEENIAVILPNTQYKGAKRFVHDFCINFIRFRGNTLWLEMLTIILLPGFTTSIGVLVQPSAFFLS